ncbi:MAG: hypothetical protein AAFQ74_08430 [Cyanobacteria bacterium J06623_4]
MTDSQELSIDDVSSERVAEPLGIERQTSTGIPESIKDETQREAAEYYSDPKRRLEEARADQAEEYVKVISQDREERVKYAEKLFMLICSWLIAVLLILLGSGVSYQPSVSEDDGQAETSYVLSFELSDTVLLALIGGTTINVLGLFVIVANYLFNAPKDPTMRP